MDNLFLRSENLVVQLVLNLVNKWGLGKKEKRAYNGAMIDPSCIFCKIVSGEIPATKVYEDEDSLAFLDIQPVNLGHTLFIPKAHFPSFLETPSQVISRLIPKLQKVAQAVKKGVETEGGKISLNNNPAAPPLVIHTHFHIIPRFNDDGLKHWGHREYNKEEFSQAAEKIKNAFN